MPGKKIAPPLSEADKQEHNQREAKMQIQVYQDVDSRSLEPALEEHHRKALKTQGARDYFDGKPTPPNTDQEAWEEIWKTNRARRLGDRLEEQTKGKVPKRPIVQSSADSQRGK